MNKLTYLLAVFCICSLSVTSTTIAEESTATTKKILPYIEADAELDSKDGEEFLVWVKPNKVVFGTHGLLNFRDSSCSTDKPHRECPKSSFNRSKILMSFDISTQKTTFNIKNQFIQKQFDALSQRQSYSFHRCPYHIADGARHIRLKLGDGCLREEGWKTRQSSKSSFFHVSKGGQKTPINNNTLYSILDWAWIDWLDAYILGTKKLSNKHAENNKNIRVSAFYSPKSTQLTPLKIRKGRHGINNIRPTRAGVVANVRAPGSSSEMYGITLWHGERHRYNIASKTRKMEVSPDGCHVAYLAPKETYEMHNGQLLDITYNKLRVIDVCEGFNVKRDTNPFSELVNNKKQTFHLLGLVKSSVANLAKKLSRATQAF